MSLWIIWALIIGLVLFAVFTGGFKKNKFIFSVLLLIFSIGLILYTGIINNDINSMNLISSFFSETDASGIASPDNLSDVEVEFSWMIDNGAVTNISRRANSFRLSPKYESLWWENNRSTIVYRKTQGDFLFSAMVKTRKNSDTLGFPDNAMQFGGIMLRDPSSGKKGENYISISVGFRDDKLQIETKSTAGGETTASGFPWPSGDAELMIQSETGVYGLYARPYGTKAEWIRFQTYYRPDLPDNINAGLITYSYGTNIQDLIVFFDGISIRRQDE